MISEQSARTPSDSQRGSASDQTPVQTTYPAIYFGTWGGPGHFAHLPDMNWVPRGTRLSNLTPWGHDGLDRAPKWDVTPGSRYSGHYGKQGDAVLRHKDGWTCLAVADYTVDSRPNSHASFVFLGHLTFEEAVERAREVFPRVVARVGEIREVPNGV